MLDIGIGCNARMRAGFYRVVFGGKAEGVEAHRVENVAAVHAQIAAVNVGSRITFRMPDVQPLSGRVGKHVQHVGAFVFGNGRVFGYAESFIFFPIALPFGFNRFKGIFCHTNLEECNSQEL